MECCFSEIISLTSILQEFRNIYIAVTFAVLGFVIQKRGYSNNVERYVISFAFLFFAIGNLYQIWQTTNNIEMLINPKCENFIYVTPLQALLTHVPFDIVVFCILMFAFKINTDNKTGQAFQQKK